MSRRQADSGRPILFDGIGANIEHDEPVSRFEQGAFHRVSHYAQTYE
jgi:hypothetical protein